MDNLQTLIGERIAKQRKQLRISQTELAEQLADKLGTKLFKTTIREAIAVKEAQISQQSLFDYAPKAKVTEDYRALGFDEPRFGLTRQTISSKAV